MSSARMRAAACAVRQRVDVGEAVEGRDQPRAHVAAGIGAVGVAVDLETVAVVAFDQLGDQISGRVVVKIRRQIADAQAAGPRRGMMRIDLLLRHGEMLDPFARAKQLIGAGRGRRYQHEGRDARRVLPHGRQ